MSELEEFKGRINILEQQRNDALNQNVILGGQLQVAVETIKVLEDGNDASAAKQKDTPRLAKRTT